MMSPFFVFPEALLIIVVVPDAPIVAAWPEKGRCIDAVNALGEE